jgi:predicted transcriptional regulator
MVARPTVHGPSATVAELRAFFADDHVHAALLVDDGRLLGVIERTDLASTTDDETPALQLATLDRRTIAPDAPLSRAHALVSRAGRRRLAVTTETSRLLGLLCLKANGDGFCSDQDVTARRRPHARTAEDPPRRATVETLPG